MDPVSIFLMRAAQPSLRAGELAALLPASELHRNLALARYRLPVHALEPTDPVSMSLGALLKPPLRAG